MALHRSGSFLLKKLSLYKQNINKWGGNLLTKQFLKSINDKIIFFAFQIIIVKICLSAICISVLSKINKNKSIVQLLFNSVFNNLIQMIARTLSRRLLSLRLVAPSTRAIFTKTTYSFSRKVQKATPSFTSIVEGEIKAEQSNLTDVSGLEETFKNNGWSLARENTLVELTRTTGKYTVRLLSNIKSPSNFDQEEQNQQNQEQEENPYTGDMNEVSILVTKAGSEKTMVINTIVTESFEISNITFAENYQSAKQHRLDIYNTNAYTGPEMETVSDQLFDAIYGFLEQECKIDNQTLVSLADYCIDSEQQFYINWLKDLKNIL